MRSLGPLLLLAAILSSDRAHAFSMDTNLFYLSDSFSSSSDSTSTRMFADLSLNLDLANKGQFTIGWGYSILNLGDNNGSTETSFSLTEMGPRFGYYIDKNKAWAMFFTYNLQAKATYDTGSTPLEWRGSSYKFEFGYRPELFERLRAGMHLIYYSAAFSEELSNSTTYTLISNSRAIIYPAFSLSYHFD